MRLTIGEIARCLQLSAKGAEDAVVSSVATDNRQIRPGGLFVCIPGSRVDGHDFAADAVRRGAVLVLAQKELPDIRFGNFDDSFMCEDHDGYNRESWTFFGKDRYKTAPFGGEFSYYSNSDQRHCLDEKGMHGRVFEDEVAKYHMTFIISNDQPAYQTKERFKASAMSMGYRFAVKDLRVKDNVAAVCVANGGVAPIYRDAFIAVNGVRSAASLQKLMPGEEMWVEVTDPSISKDKCVVTIECDHLVKGQRIQFDADVK